MEEDINYKAGGTTLPDYQNYRNIIFWQWEEFNNAVVEYRICVKGEYKIFKKEVKRTFLKFFAQINDESKLGHLEKTEIKKLKKLYDNPNLLTINNSVSALNITRKLMHKYGIFNMEDRSHDIF